MTAILYAMSKLFLWKKNIMSAHLKTMVETEIRKAALISMLLFVGAHNNGSYLEYYLQCDVWCVW